jgi:O-antigen/teichoic acid export membrane protein
VPRPRIGRAGGGIAAISSGAALGQAVALLATPVLSRLYSPAEFGAYASLIAMVTIAATAGSLRLESAVSIASAGDERSLVGASAWASLVAGLACAALMSATRHEAISSHPLAGSLLVIFLVWVTAMYTVLIAYSLRSLQYSVVARGSALQTLGMVGGQLAVSRWIKSAVGLAAGMAIGRSIGVASMAWESQLLKGREKQAKPKLSVILTQYWRFPVVFMPSALLNVLGTQLPILLVTRVHGTESAGNLAQALSVGAIPAALVGSAISSVVMAEMAARVRAGELDQRARYIRISKALLPLGIVWFLLLITAGPPLLPIVLGSQWSESGRYLAALAVTAATGLVVSPVSVVFVLYERALLNILLDTGRIVVVGGLGLVAWRLGLSPVRTVSIMSFGMAFVYIAIWLLGLRTSSGAPASRSLRPGSVDQT